MVAVIECLVNQNVRDAGAANSAAMCWDLMTLCHAHGAGLMVMPCPEVACLGPLRERPAGVSIDAAMRTEAGRQSCAALARAVADRVQASLLAGNEVLAVLGGNEQSPGCAVHRPAAPKGLRSGALIQALQDELRRRGLDIPFRGLRDADPAMLAEDLSWLRAILASQPPGVG